jgi:hypothetical protein
METLVHKCQIPIGTVEYEVQVYSRPDGRHVAKTILDEADIVINDGPTLEAALRRHAEVLPLAINSRQLFLHKRDTN